MAIRLSNGIYPRIGRAREWAGVREKPSRMLISVWVLILIPTTCYSDLKKFPKLNAYSVFISLFDSLIHNWNKSDVKLCSYVYYCTMSSECGEMIAPNFEMLFLFICVSSVALISRITIICICTLCASCILHVNIHSRISNV